MTRSNPPFRADHVGSFLRPEKLIEARQLVQQDRISSDNLREIEDICILDIIRRQQDVGLKGITDGEFRRSYFHLDFLEKLKGVEVRYGEFSAKFKRDDGTEIEFEPPTMHIV
ncbi:MAG: 5-methyltetrahydropteroyltriglutamate--homocysteine S-methyltransferase, partial [Desulfobulbia bacterium]